MLAGTETTSSISNSGAFVYGAGRSEESTLSMFTPSSPRRCDTDCMRPGWSMAQVLSRKGSAGGRSAAPASAGRSSACTWLPRRSDPRPSWSRLMALSLPATSIIIANWPRRLTMRLSSRLPPRSVMKRVTSSTRPGRSSPTAVSTA